MPKQTSSPEIQSRIDEDVSSINFRHPVVGDYSQGILDSSSGDMNARVREYTLEQEEHEAAVDRQWMLLTEASRRAILASPDIRDALGGEVKGPLEETLPLRVVGNLETRDTLTATVASRYTDSLGARLALPPVPDSLLNPDITHAQPLRDAPTVKYSLGLAMKYSPDTYDDKFEALRLNAQNNPGVSKAERRLVAQRYRFARDTKMLGLMAELLDNPVPDNNQGGNVVAHELPSGVKLAITREAFESEPALLDPARWESRRQLKDRVYAVRIGGKEYIQKERKTARHTDTKEHGHKPGLTSLEEFDAARKFSGLGTIEQNGVRLRWEKPVAYAEFPDGYQFCLFESEGDLDTDWPTFELRLAVEDAAELYQGEFAALQAKSKRVLAERTDLIPDYLREKPEQPKRFAFLRGSRKHKNDEGKELKHDELTFQEFAELKANMLVLQARQMLTDTMHEMGYTNSDLDGYGFRVSTDNRIGLDIIGFDFEYYSYEPSTAAESARRAKEYKAGGKAATSQVSMSASNRGIAVAAAYAMLDDMGMRLPPKPD